VNECKPLLLGTGAPMMEHLLVKSRIMGRGLHSLVHFSAQLEPYVPLKIHPEYPQSTP